MAHHKRRSRRNCRVRYYSCGCCKDKTFNGQAPIEDGPCTGKVKKKKVKEPDVCPKRPDGKTKHQYLTDTEEVVTVWWKGWPDEWEDRYTRKYKLCVWCGKEKTLKVTSHP